MATQTTNDIRELNIYQRMIKATEEIGTVAKNLSVQVTKTNTYKAVSERDILDAVKPIEIKYGIYSYPKERQILSEEVQERETQFGIRKELFMRIKTVYRFVNVDDPGDFIETISYADGIDSGDKATGKAMTYADKYALMKAYKISTGEDPDAEASTSMTSSNMKASVKQLETISKYYVGDNLAKLLKANNIDKLEDLPKQKASELIGKLFESQKSKNDAEAYAANYMHEDAGDRI